MFRALMTWITFLKEPTGSLCRMHHRSPIWIITHHTYLLCSSFYRTILRTTVLISNIFIIIDILLFKTWIFTKNYMIFNLKWFLHIIIAFVSFFSLPWRWPYEWPKHVRDNYVIKFYSQIQVHFLIPFTILYKAIKVFYLPTDAQ